MIFVKLILGGFGILMSNMSQVQNILLFQGCDKRVLRLHTAGTESPDTHKHIRVPPISMNIIQIPPDTHQTSSRYPPDISREQTTTDNRRQTTTDANRHRQMYSNSTCQCLLVSGAVCLCLLLSVVVWWHLLLPGDVLWVSGGCLVVIWGYLNDIHGNWRHWDVFGGIWALSPCSMEP